VLTVTKIRRFVLYTEKSQWRQLQILNYPGDIF
jgi:hypothetical protein